MSGKKIAVSIFRLGMVLALIGLISDSVSYSWVIIGYSIVGIGLIGELYFYIKQRRKYSNGERRGE